MEDGDAMIKAKNGLLSENLRCYLLEVKEEALSGWARWGSFAAIWAWCNIGMRFQEFAPAFLLSDDAVNYMDFVVFGIIASLIIVLALGKKIASLLDSKLIYCAITIILFLGSLATFSGGVLFRFELIIGGALASGVAIGLLKVVWGELFSRTSIRVSLIDLGLAVTCSSLCSLILCTTPNELLYVAYFICALMSAYLLYQGRKVPEKDSDVEVVSTPSKLTLSWSFFVVPGLIALTHGLLMGYAHVVTTASYSVNIFLILSELVAGVALLYIVFKFSQNRMTLRFYSLSLIVTVIGYLGFTLVNDFQEAGLALNNFGFVVFYFFMIVYWGSLSSLTGKTVIQVYALGYLCFQFANLVGSLLVALFGELLTNEFWNLLTFLVVVLYLITIVFLLGDSSSRVYGWLVPTVSTESWETKLERVCTKFAQQYLLTPREEEILFFLSKGRNAPYIGKQLFVSSETVRTHIKSIYNKSGIHSQQELMDAIDLHLR